MTIGTGFATTRPTANSEVDRSKLATLSIGGAKDRYSAMTVYLPFGTCRVWRVVFQVRVSAGARRMEAIDCGEPKPPNCPVAHPGTVRSAEAPLSVSIAAANP